MGLIEVRHLRYLLAAAEHGSFRKAAAALGIQESAVRSGKDAATTLEAAELIAGCRDGGK
ncbi:LysR family transcriptional regulator [Nitrobacter sp. TKz-YC02]|uniref:LysR family transcriptional regulator n=1 Tax=Nitrobacter sp. TKz-YC02 TaxID=3398704 RepID=UPI003CF50910